MKYPKQKRGAHPLPLLITAAILTISTSARTAPLVVLQKSTESGQLVITATGSDLPAVKRITFSCSYSLPPTLIRQSIVSCPIPSTVISAAIDTAAATLQIGITATTTISPAPQATLLKIRIPSSSAGVAPVGDLNVTRAAIRTGNGDSLNIELQAAMVQQPMPPHRTRPQQYSPAPENRKMFTIDGRAAGRQGIGYSPGFFIAVNEHNSTRILTLRSR